jgi:peroxiredoxin
MRVLFISTLIATTLFTSGTIAQQPTKLSQTVTVEDAAKTALNVGAKIPEFTLNDPLGKRVSTNDLLKQGNLVIVFYRGAWCPFCNRYLHTLQENLPRIKENGGVLVAISVENADRSMAISKKNDLTYTVLSDPNLTVARMFKIVYQMPDALNERYKAGGLDVAKYNSMDKAELPISATYIVNKKGEITYAHIEPDYKKRPTPDEIVAALTKLK